jgi:hypothetical protein
MAAEFNSSPVAENKRITTAIKVATTVDIIFVISHSFEFKLIQTKNPSGCGA